MCLVIVWRYLYNILGTTIHTQRARRLLLCAMVYYCLSSLFGIGCSVGSANSCNKSISLFATVVNIAQTYRGYTTLSLNSPLKSRISSQPCRLGLYTTTQTDTDSRTHTNIIANAFTPFLRSENRRNGRHASSPRHSGYPCTPSVAFLPSLSVCVCVCLGATRKYSSVFGRILQTFML